MTNTLDVYIGEFRPWPESVCVIRDMTSEIRRYVPEELGTRALLDGVKLMGENRRLADLVADMLVTVRAAGRLGVDVGKVQEYGRRARELGIEVYG